MVIIQRGWTVSGKHLSSRRFVLLLNGGNRRRRCRRRRRRSRRDAVPFCEEVIPDSAENAFDAVEVSLGAVQRRVDLVKPRANGRVTSIAKIVNCFATLLHIQYDP